jgi:hypothetical protein
MQPYYTVVIPWVPFPYATKWHPTDQGSFNPLTRGAFETLGEAIEWARAHLNGAPYMVRLVEDR